MDRRRSIGCVIERHFGASHKSQRRTMAALAWGLLMAGRLGLASIARGMADGTTPPHRIKRVWRFASNRRIRIRKATLCLVQWLVWSGRGRAMVVLDWTDIGRRRVMLSAAACVGRRRVRCACGGVFFTTRRPVWWRTWL